ncbi:type VI secretion system Vgr family protein [Sinomicrobium soli]|uniref:type VI secretion system Vgr family protein n=1 Tax=Sinomicrobium sp. N-1-3-6 TaxID=2219864 RepID=UPI000DCC8346|nr:phage baseplate assembly protein V [Sinomicrobium sp. N-1-3-6]RAV29183.1 hypothetical protein DN748_09700 [Sinomicrobium sp. N-1-3-6]
MTLQTDVRVKIGGLDITTFVDFELSQGIDRHHELTIECREEEVYLRNPGLKGNYHQLIGETILVSMQSTGGMFSSDTGYFKGIVTRIKTRNINDSTGRLLQFRAYSPTILMDNGPESMSFLQKSLSDVVHESTREYDTQLLKIRTQPLKDTPYPYVVQYNESDFHFLKRLCSRQGEWFYYNGTEVIIGQENIGEEIALHYGFNLSRFDFEMSLRPTRFKYNGNDLSEGERLKSTTRDYESTANGIAAELVKSSGRVFSKETTVQHNQLVNEGTGKADMDAFAEMSFKRHVANMVFLNASSENPALRPGVTVRILDEDGSSQGLYKVIDVVHRCMDTGDYNNTFRAVPASVQVSPYSIPGEYPRCESQAAIVKENNDPKGLGRVKVQMAWQQENALTTDWIPLSTPNGGSGKGFHFIPEIGESVMVDFQSGNAEMPYVTGSVQHNQAKSGYADSDNNLKAIQSKSGNKIIMNDKDGSITITDKGAALLVMDGAGNININGSTSKNINIGEGASTLNMDKNGVINFSGNEQFAITVGESSLILKKDGVIEINGKDIKVTGTANTLITAKNNHIAGQTKMDGGEVFIN